MIIMRLCVIKSKFILNGLCLCALLNGCTKHTLHMQSDDAHACNIPSPSSSKNSATTLAEQQNILLQLFALLNAK